MLTKAINIQIFFILSFTKFIFCYTAKFTWVNIRELIGSETKNSRAMRMWTFAEFTDGEGAQISLLVRTVWPGLSQLA